MEQNYKYKIAIQLGNKLLSYETDSYIKEDIFYKFIDKTGAKRFFNKNYVISIEQRY